jgi:hypothetical protein
MPWHQIWHVAILGTILVAAAAGVIVWLGPLLLDWRGGALPAARRLMLVMLGLALGLIATEWFVIHGRFL